VGGGFQDEYEFHEASHLSLLSANIENIEMWRACGWKGVGNHSAPMTKFKFKAKFEVFFNEFMGNK